MSTVNKCTTRPGMLRLEQYILASFLLCYVSHNKNEANILFYAEITADPERGWQFAESDY